MDNFIEQINSLSKRVKKIVDNLSTEEATKTSIIMPFFQILGYDIFNPEEFLPEYTADVGIKKGEKVDYAIMENGQPLILIEAKSANQKLEKHDSQLFRYFGTTPAKFAILTNGINYRFYTDLVEQNKMDATPFFEFNLLEPRENLILELAKFRKKDFDVNDILNTASELKYTGEIKQVLQKQWENPTEEFIAFIISEIYSGKKTKSVIEKFQPLVKKSLRQFINDQVNDKLKAALANTDEDQNQAQSTTDINEGNENNGQEIEETPKVITTEEEIEGFVISRFLLKDVVESDRVYYRDNLSYFNILLDDNIRKWICRLGLNSNSSKYIQFNDENRTVFTIEKVSDIEKYKDHFVSVVKKFL